MQIKLLKRKIDSQTPHFYKLICTIQKNLRMNIGINVLNELNPYSDNNYIDMSNFDRNYSYWKNNNPTEFNLYKRKIIFLSGEVLLKQIKLLIIIALNNNNLLHNLINEIEKKQRLVLVDSINFQ